MRRKIELRYLYIWFFNLRVDAFLFIMGRDVRPRSSEIYISFNSKWKCIDIEAEKPYI